MKDAISNARALNSDTAPRRFSRAGLLVATLLFIHASLATRASGFGVEGKVFTPLPGVSESASAIVRQPDGRLVTAGSVGDGFFVVRHNADGTLDTSFGSGGRVVTGFPGGSAAAAAMALQPDGKIVVAGTILTEESYRFVVARYNADGTLDSSFDGDGRVTTDFAEGAKAYAVVVQPDGKIVAAGESNHSYALARYNADGTLDSSFDGDGRVITDLSASSDAVYGLALQPDGKIVAAGGAPYTDVAYRSMGVARYHADGSLDMSFGDKGSARISRPNGFAVARAVALQLDGKIVLSGYATDSSDFTAVEDNQFAVARFHPNGTPDFSFGSTGIVLTIFTPGLGSDAAQAIAIQPDGKIIAAGAVRYHIGSSVENYSLRAVAGVARYNTNGTLDTSFGTGGKATAPFNDLTAPSEASLTTHTHAVAARGVALQPDGKIVTAGRGYYPGTKRDIVLTRFNPNGSLDDGSSSDMTPGDAFGANGKARTDFGLLAEDNVGEATALLPDGRILVAGGGGMDGDIDGSGQFDLVRYTSNGEQDLTFGTVGRAAAVFSDAGGLVPAAATSLAVQPNGRVVVGGYIHGGEYNGRFYRAALARFTADGALDPEFGVGGTVVSEFAIGFSIEVALQADGKIVLVATTAFASSSPTGRDVIVARYNADGSPDSSFHGDGYLSTDFSDLTGGGEESLDEFSRGIVIQPDGRIVIAAAAEGKILLARYNPDGSPDGTFDGDGRAVLETGGFTSDLALQPDGRFVVVSTLFGEDRSSDVLLARFNADGSPDTGFGSGGTAVGDFGANEEGTAVAIDAGGRIVIAGESSGEDDSDFLIARFNPDGSPDLSFGTQGRMTKDFFGERDEAHDLVLRPDGRPIAVGRATTTDSMTSIALAGTGGGGRLLNIATRMRVQTGENVLIGGLIVTGTEPKRVIIRAIGSSLAQVFDGALADPVLELYQGDTLVAANDNWRDTQQSEIEATTIPPSDDRESAIVQTLAPGFYTAIMSGKEGTSGIGVIEAYDLAAGASSKLGNIASRGFVDSGDNVMIGGLIVGGDGEATTRVLVRAIGPSIGKAGVAGALQDPTLELRDNNGDIVRENDNWRDSQAAEIEATTIPPSDPAESAIIATLPPGNYTAVVRGKDGTTGVGLVEVYSLQ